MHVHPGGNKSLFTLHILSVVYGSPLESDMYSGFMHVYMHVCVRKYQTIYREFMVTHLQKNQAAKTQCKEMD